MTKALREAWASMEGKDLTQRKKELTLYNLLRSTPYWFYYNGTVHPPTGR